MRKFLALLLLLLLIAGGVWFAAGGAAGPTIAIGKPGALVGQTGELDMTVEAPAAKLNALDVAIEQDGARIPLFSMPGDESTKLTTESADRVRLTRSIGKKSLPALKQGKARLVVSATRPVLFGYREASSTAARDFEVKLTPPRVGVVSLHHFINHGGSEVVVYKVTPADAESGVRVGDRVYPGYPASGAGVATADPSLKVAFFALTYDQDLNDADQRVRTRCGGQRGAGLVRLQGDSRRHSAAAASTSTIRSSPAWCRRFSTARRTLKVDDPSNLLQSYLTINRELRRRNNETIATLATKSVARDRLEGPVQAAHQLRRRIGLRGSTDVHLQGQGGRSAGASRLRPRVDTSGARPGVECRSRGPRRLPGHLRQLRDPRSRHGAAVPLRAPLDHRRAGGPGGRSRGRRSDGAARRGWQAAITCTSRCCSAVRR